MKTLLMVAVCIAAVSASPDSVKIDECTCFERGNYYTTVVESGCTHFLQRTAYLRARTLRCHYPLIFDVDECVCNYRRYATCPRRCSPQTTPPPGRSCREAGNIYTLVPGTRCSRFTQATDALGPQEHSCPAGLQFDVSTCVCNWANKVHCWE